MDGEAVEKIRELAERGITVGHELELYSPVRMYPIYHDPRPPTIVIRTLDGLCDYITMNDNGWDISHAMVIIEGPQIVRLVSEIYGKSRQPDTIMVVQADVCESFPFDKFLPPEEFQIALRSRVVETAGRQAILQYIARIDAEATDSLQDDGVAQRITTKRGVSGAVKETEFAPSVVVLQPYRTFTTLNQPESEFVFRISSAGGVKFGLFEADGGAWRGRARFRIKDYLDQELDDIKPADKPLILA